MTEPLENDELRLQIIGGMIGEFPSLREPVRHMVADELPIGSRWVVDWKKLGVFVAAVSLGCVGFYLVAFP